MNTKFVIMLIFHLLFCYIVIIVIEMIFEMVWPVSLTWWAESLAIKDV